MIFDTLAPAKAGVMLLGLSPQTRDQPSSLMPEEPAPTGGDNSALMEAMDHNNLRWGGGQCRASGLRQECRNESI